MMNMMTLLSQVALPGALSLETAFGSDIVQMILHAGLMVKFVMFVLFLFSVVSWTIIFMKWRLFRRGKKETDFFLDLFGGDSALTEINSECDDLGFSPVVHLFQSGYAEIRRIGKIQASPSSEDRHSTLQTLSYNVERALKKATIEQSNRLEKALSFLATTGNTAPFIGLFGTVWGIMESFRGIGMKGSASLAVVAPGISEALIATAAGLAAAIPAVVAFNYFNHKVLVARSEMDTFSSDFLSMVERQIFKKRMGPKKD